MQSADGRRPHRVLMYQRFRQSFRALHEAIAAFRKFKINLT